MTPLRTTSQAMRNSLIERCIEPVCSTRWWRLTAAITSIASRMVWVSGFSQYASLPDANAASVI